MKNLIILLLLFASCGRYSGPIPTEKITGYGIVKEIRTHSGYSRPVVQMDDGSRKEMLEDGILIAGDRVVVYYTSQYYARRVNE